MIEVRPLDETGQRHCGGLDVAQSNRQFCQRCFGVLGHDDQVSDGVMGGNVDDAIHPIISVTKILGDQGRAKESTGIGHQRGYHDRPAQPAEGGNIPAIDRPAKASIGVVNARKLIFPLQAAIAAA